MSLLRRIVRRRELSAEQICPRCGVPAPADAIECAACGWDMREASPGTHPGSNLPEPHVASPDMRDADAD